MIIISTTKQNLFKDEILQQKVAELDTLKLQGSERINEFADIMKKYDPRIVSMAVKSVGSWKDWVLDTQQQQQQQQQVQK